MKNVDGNYDEIVKWLDDQERKGIRHVEGYGHGRLAGGQHYNVGLFSLNEDYYNVLTAKAWTCSFSVSRTHVADQYVNIEETVKSHLIVF